MQARAQMTAIFLLPPFVVEVVEAEDTEATEEDQQGRKGNLVMPWPTSKQRPIDGMYKTRSATTKPT